YRCLYWIQLLILDSSGRPGPRWWYAPSCSSPSLYLSRICLLIFSCNFSASHSILLSLTPYLPSPLLYPYLSAFIDCIFCLYGPHSRSCLYSLLLGSVEAVLSSPFLA